MNNPLDDSPFEKRNGVAYAPFTYYPPPCPVPDTFKRALLRIGGMAPNGHPCLRIGWGMDIKIHWSGEALPRYVKSKRPRSTEYFDHDRGIWAVKGGMDYWGDPRWIIEEWKAPETFMIGDDPEKEWEDHRKEYFYDSYQQLEGPEGPIWQIGDIQVTTEKLAMTLARNGISIDDILMEGKLQPVVERRRVLLGKPIDKHGPFPRSGRYECLCHLPYGQNPSPTWLTIIEETLNRRNHRKFVDTDWEIADMMDQMRAKEEGVEAEVEAGIREDLEKHIHLFFDASPRKGGSGQSIVTLSGKEWEK